MDDLKTGGNSSSVLLPESRHLFMSQVDYVSQFGCRRTDRTAGLP